MQICKHIAKYRHLICVGHTASVAMDYLHTQEVAHAFILAGNVTTTLRSSTIHMESL